LVLDLEYIPRTQRCPKCAYDFRMTDFDPRCPLCGELATECISGEELDIAYMEVDE
jgi:Zn finger protein HypA/HybF involved in hydrogenase expression